MELTQTLKFAFLIAFIAGSNICLATPKAAPKPAPKCGDVIEKNTTLTADLDCTAFDGYFALAIRTDGIRLNGNGFRIIAPQARAGIFVTASNIRISNIKITGLQNGTGIFAADADNLSVVGNDLSDNVIGVELYSQNRALNNFRV